jgi:hypothetical protein
LRHCATEFIPPHWSCDGRLAALAAGRGVSTLPTEHELCGTHARLAGWVF